jgi:hypothetical protein
MDLSASIVPKSDQINAEDLLTGPRTFTIEKVSAGSAEQPVDVHLVELPGRPYRPSKSMRRVMVSAWGPEASAYTGRRLTLYRNPATKFGGMIVGGIEISHLSHIDKRRTLALTVTRGKRAPFVVEPLPDVAPVNAPNNSANNSEPTAAQVAACTDVDALRALYDAATSPERRAQIRARKAELLAAPAPEPDDPAAMTDDEFAALTEPAFDGRGTV